MFFISKDKSAIDIQWDEKIFKVESKVSRKTDRTAKKIEVETKEKQSLPEFKNGVLEIRLDELEIGEQISMGGFSTIHRGRYCELTHPTRNIIALIRALNNASSIIKKVYPTLTSLNLFSVGYSEGSIYSVLLEKCIKIPQNCNNAKLDPLYQYQGAVGLNGAYDLRQTVNFLVSRVSKQHNNPHSIENITATNFGKPPMLAMLIISYIYYSESREDYQNLMSAEFWKMKCAAGLESELCSIDGIQFQDILSAMKSYKSSIEIAKSISYGAFGRTCHGQKEKYLGHYKRQYEQGSHNQVYGLVSQQLINSRLFNQVIKQASAINYESTKPVFLFSLLRNSIVPVKNTQKYAKIHNKTKTYYLQNSLHKVCENEGQISNVDHTSGELVSNLFALSFIKNITASLINKANY